MLYKSNQANVSDKCLDMEPEKCLDVDELTKKFAPKKQDSLLLARTYADLGLKLRSQRVAECGSFLEFTHEIEPGSGSISEKGRLTNANFCRDLLCPMCSWRKSLKQVAQISKVLVDERIRGKYKFLFLTLTIPNVPYGYLSVGINKNLKSFDRLMKRKKYKKLILGYFRALEVTINTKTGTFHPHLHVMLAVPLSYGKKSGMYFTRDEILKDWQEVTGDDSITQVDIRVAYNPRKAEIPEGSDYTITAAALELAKYAAKIPSRMYEPKIVSALLEGLSRRRTYSYGGILKKVYQQLGLEDLEEADLIHINDEVPDPVMKLIVRYGWNPAGYHIVSTKVEGGISDECDKVC